MINKKLLKNSGVKGLKGLSNPSAKIILRKKVMNNFHIY